MQLSEDGFELIFINKKPIISYIVEVDPNEAK
jgi:hypothetical protein